MRRRLQSQSRAPRFLLEKLEQRTHLSTSIPLSQTTWTPLGPAAVTNGQTPGSLRTAGKVLGVAAHPTDPNIIYAATAGGIWKTTDGGTNWAALTDSQSTTITGSIAVSKSNPNIIYAGTGEATNEGYSNYGRGVLKSIDGGASWSLLGTSQFDRRAIGDIVIDPTNPSIVYAAVSANSVNVNLGGTGIYRSTDGGANWTNTTSSITTFTAFSDLKMDPSNPSTLFCAIGGPRGEAYNGVYKTTDGGNNWDIAGDYPQGNFAGRTELAISPSNSQVIYAALAGTGGIGSVTYGAVFAVAKSTNGGANWTALSNVPNYMKDEGYYNNAIGVDPSDPNRLYLGGGERTNSFVMSTNGGTSFSFIDAGANGNGPHDGQQAFAFDASGRLLAAGDGGLFRLNNNNPGSINWVSLAGNMNNTQVLSVALHPTDPNIALAGSLDNGLLRFNDNSAWTRLLETDSSIVNNDHGAVFFDAAGAGTAYVVSPSVVVGTSRIVRRNDSGASVGSAWASKSSGISISNQANSAYLAPFVADPTRAGRLVIGTDRIYESTNGGDSWTARSTVGASGWSGSRAIRAVGVSATDINTIYAVTSDGSANLLIQYTSNRGTSWTARTISGVNDNIAQVLVDPQNAQTAYAIRDRFGGTQIYRTTDGGANWSAIDGNLPDLPVNCINIDAGDTGTTADDVLYIGTDQGVYRSTNLGGSWTKFGASLPNTPVMDLQFNANKSILAAATLGRGVWEISLGAPAPTVVSWAFNSVTLPMTLSVQFSANVSASLSAADFNVVTTVPVANTPLPFTLSYNTSNNTATLTFNGVIPDSWYRATINGAGVTEPGGTPMVGSPFYDFEFLLGDANNNLFVGSGDFATLVANFGQTNRNHNQGDYSFDGKVDTVDFNIFLSQFAKILPPQPSPPAALPQAGALAFAPSPTSSPFAGLPIRSNDDDAFPELW